MLRGIKIGGKKNDQQTTSKQTIKREEWMLKPERTIPKESETPKKETPTVEEPKDLPDGLTGGKGSDSDSKKPAVIGDAGASWRARALKRAQERAQQEGTSVDEILANTGWGSTTDLEKSIEESDKLRKSERRREMRFKAPERRDLRWRRKERDDERRDEHKWKDDRSYHRRDEKRYERSHDRFDERRYDRRDDRRYEKRDEEMDRKEPEKQEVPKQVSEEKEEQTSVSQEQLEQDINKLAAKALKAQLMNNKELYEKLTKQVEELKKGIKPKEVILPELDSRGKPISSLTKAEIKAERHVKTTIDESMDIKEMVRKIKSGEGEEDYDLAYAKALQSSSAHERDTDEQFDQMGTSKKSKKRRRENELKRQRKRHISEYNKIQTIAETCLFCFGSRRIRKELIISLGEKMYLSLPPGGSMISGHCIIAPLEHKLAVTELDEDEWYELQKFRQGLKKMFAEQHKDVLFLETVTEYNRRKQLHMVMECIPLPVHIADQAPSYFKKAISESDVEWSQHKKLIDTRGKGISGSIPRDFPYFHVEFSLKGGFAHVIEDDRHFSRYFGREVIAGMLKLPPNVVKDKERVDFEQEREELAKFVKAWQKYDWTVELEGGEY